MTVTVCWTPPPDTTQLSLSPNVPVRGTMSHACSASSNGLTGAQYVGKSPAASAVSKPPFLRMLVVENTVSPPSVSFFATRALNRYDPTPGPDLVTTPCSLTMSSRYRLARNPNRMAPPCLATINAPVDAPRIVSMSRWPRGRATDPRPGSLMGSSMSAVTMERVDGPRLFADTAGMSYTSNVH